MSEKSVVVQHIEGDAWALVLVASRSAYGRRTIVPMVFANAECGIFAGAPQLKQWARASLVALYSPPVERREEILTNAVQEFIRQISLRSFIVERSSVGIVARAKARGVDFNEPQNGFAMTRESEPAFFWLAEKSDAAVQAFRVLMYLIKKNSLGDLTQGEREALGEKLLTRGERLKDALVPRR